MPIKTEEEQKRDGQMAQRNGQVYVILEMLEQAEDALHAGQLATTQRLLRTAITALNEYAEHRVLLQKIERLGVDAPSTVRYIDEYRRRHEAV